MIIAVGFNVNNECADDREILQEARKIIAEITKTKADAQPQPADHGSTGACFLGPLFHRPCMTSAATAEEAAAEDVYLSNYSKLLSILK